jgi:hypothetical protein
VVLDIPPEQDYVDLLGDGVSAGVVIPFVDNDSQATFDVSGPQQATQWKGNRGGAVAGGCLNTKASVHVPAYLHPSGVRRVGPGWAVTGALKTHSIGSLFEGICVIIESKSIAQDNMPATCQGEQSKN